MTAPGWLLLRLSAWVDALIIAAAFAWTWQSTIDQWSPFAVFSAAFIIPLWHLLFNFYGLYESHRVEGRRAIARKVLSVQALGVGVVGAAAVLIGVEGITGPWLTFGSISTALLLAQKLAVYSVLQNIRKRGYDARSVCVIGTLEKGREMAARFLAHPQWGSTVTCIGVGPADVREFVSCESGEKVAGSLEEVLSLEVIDEVLITTSAAALPEEKRTLQLCAEHGVLARVLLDTSEAQIQEPRLESFYGHMTMAVVRNSRDEGKLLIKRAIDLVFASLLLIALMPVLLIIAVLVKLSGPGPALFSQTRVGLHGRRFCIYKFRTMVDGAEALLPTVAHRSITNGPVFKDPDDFRVTNFGRLLRRCSLDELPQLINVVRGEMSLVGPRPLPVHESGAITGSHRRRFSMRPGITCLWQVNGRSNVDYVSWMRYDLEYVDGWSLALDAKLLLQTIPVVFSGRGAY